MILFAGGNKHQKVQSRSKEKNEGTDSETSKISMHAMQRIME